MSFIVAYSPNKVTPNKAQDTFYDQLQDTIYGAPLTTIDAIATVCPQDPILTATTGRVFIDTTTSDKGDYTIYREPQTFALPTHGFFGSRSITGPGTALMGKQNAGPSHSGVVFNETTDQLLGCKEIWTCIITLTATTSPSDVTRKTSGALRRQPWK